MPRIRMSFLRRTFLKMICGTSATFYASRSSALSFPLDPSEEELPGLSEVYGSGTATDTLIVYWSPSDPNALNWVSELMPAILSRYVETCRLTLVMQPFCRTPFDTIAFLGARAAGERRTDLIKWYIKHITEMYFAPNMEEALKLRAELFGVNRESFRAAINDDLALYGLRGIRERARYTFGVDVTPAFFFNGFRIPAVRRIEDLEPHFDQSPIRRDLCKLRETD